MQTLNRGNGSHIYFQPETYNILHEEYGPWHGWRFALVFKDVPLQFTKEEKEAKDAEMERLKARISEEEIERAIEINLKSQEMYHNGEDASILWLD